MHNKAEMVRKDRSGFIFILITTAVDGIGMGIMSPLVPLLLMELTGKSPSGAAVDGGWLMTLFFIIQFFATPILGNLSDRYGRRPVLLGSLAAFSINYLLLALSQTIHWLLVGTLLIGAFSATLSTINAYVADITEPSYRAKRFGMVIAAFGIGSILGPTLIGLLVRYGIRAPFYVASGIALLNFAYGLLILPESLRAEMRRPFSITRANPLGSFAHVRNRKLVLRLLGALGLMQIAAVTSSVVWAYVTIIKFAWTQREIGMSLALSAIFTVVIQGYFLSRMIRCLGTLRTVCLGFSCLTISLLGFAFAANGWIMMAFLLPLAVGSVTGATLVGYMSIHTPADAQGELQGTLASVTSLASALTPVVMTQLFSRVSAENAAIYFPGAPFLVAALCASVGLLLAVHAFKREAMPDARIAV